MVLIEQVANFCKHVHFPLVLHAWSMAGYVVAWQDTLNLLDVLPGQRVRFLLMLRHREFHGQSSLLRVPGPCIRE